MSRMNVLFLCTGNSCRSQMAEGWARHLKSDVIEAFSAGIQPTSLDPRAVKVMAECGIDISTHHSKHLDQLSEVDFDFVVTVCDHAREHCPVFLGATTMVPAGFEDPPRLAAGADSEEAALEHYRRVRDEIRNFIEAFPEE